MFPSSLLEYGAVDHILNSLTLIGSLFRDTVRSVGLVSRTLPFVESNTAIKTFRHAVSLDERRVKFRPRLYGDVKASPTDDIVKRDTEDAAESAERKRWQQRARGKKAESTTVSQTLRQTDWDEVWFAGCHIGEFGVFFGEVARCDLLQNRRRRRIRPERNNPQLGKHSPPLDDSPMRTGQHGHSVRTLKGR